MKLNPQQVIVWNALLRRFAPKRAEQRRARQKMKRFLAGCVVVPRLKPRSMGITSATLFDQWEEDQ